MLQKYFMEMIKFTRKHRKRYHAASFIIKMNFALLRIKIYRYLKRCKTKLTKNWDVKELQLN